MSSGFILICWAKGNQVIYVRDHLQNISLWKHAPASLSFFFMFQNAENIFLEQLKTLWKLPWNCFTHRLRQSYVLALEVGTQRLQWGRIEHSNMATKNSWETSMMQIYIPSFKYRIGEWSGFYFVTLILLHSFWHAPGANVVMRGGDYTDEVGTLGQEWSWTEN